MGQARNMLIIGGGAAGLVAGIQLLRGGAAVTVCERAPRVGKKLITTGNGTCNIGNRDLTVSHYHGADPDFVRPALSAFSAQDAVAFFASIGVDVVTRADGKMYPRCLQASAVLDCLRATFADLGGTLCTETEIVRLTPHKGGVTAVSANGDTMTADRVLVCTGGAASPSCGGSTGGYALLESLGHKRMPLFPSVVPLKTDTTYLRAVKGIRTDATLTLLIDGHAVAAHTGELLFTEYGLSGPVTLQIARVVGDWERKQRGRATARIDLLPELDSHALTALLRGRRALDGGHRPLELFFTGLLHNRVGQTVIRAAGLSLTDAASSLTDRDIATLVRGIKAWEVAVTGTTGLAHAQVTAGGIATADFDPATMRSRLCDRVFAAGEVLDIDGDCGGFNLHFAFASATLAARGMLV